MSNRPSISLRGETYNKLRDYCKASGQGISPLVEHKIILPYLDKMEGQQAPKVEVVLAKNEPGKELQKKEGVLPFPRSTFIF